MVHKVRSTHGCSLWSSIKAGWDKFTRHVKYVVGALGDGNRVQILHDAWPLASEKFVT